MDDELKNAIKGGAKLDKPPEEELKAREEEKKKRMEELKKLASKLEKDKPEDE
ncbi:hypothetical protein GF325_15950 [Candidatus Bathyarchaeota archaeon]|nr:hypothetical protein [Candidatus Bathyarchaeota archaeon]